MPDLLPGTLVKGADTPNTVADVQDGQYTFTNATYGVGTTGGTYADCGRVFVAPTTGRVILHYAARSENSGASSTFVAPVVREGGTVGSGQEVVAASDSNAVRVRGTDTMRFGASLLLTVLTPGAVYNVRLEHKVGANTGTAQHRSIIAAPAT